MELTRLAGGAGLSQASLFKFFAIGTRICGLFNSAFTMAAFLGALSYDSESCPSLILVILCFCSAGKSIVSVSDFSFESDLTPSACLTGAYVLALR